jgi:hypothetical protein
MSRRVRLFVFYLIVYSVFAQPGLPPCWLMAHSCSIHPHPGGHPEIPHSHNFLSDLAQAYTDGVAPALPVPIRLLIASIYMTLLFFLNQNERLIGTGWVSSPEPPPPRFSLVIWVNNLTG